MGVAMANGGNDELQIGLGVAGVALTAIGSKWSRSAADGLSKAIWWYNRDLIPR